MAMCGCKMRSMNRRDLMANIGMTAVVPLSGFLRGEVQPTGASTTAIVPPGGNRYAYAVESATHSVPCKVTSADSGGAFSAFENVVPPKMGPPLHLHHREDEWFYVASGRFLFEIDGKRTEFGQGGSVFAPRGLSHRWANIDTQNAVMLVTLIPGGFETFFDEMSQAAAKGGKLAPEEVKAIYARHQMDWLGPRIFA
jgi:mannose-6-phosphate isomerase-like protein (cupin superfamily)